MIPVRLAAQRLPGKPLLEIDGTRSSRMYGVARRKLPWGQSWSRPCTGSGAGDGSQGRLAILTREGHPTGSDRVFEAVVKLDPSARHDAVINLQGDMPDIPGRSDRRRGARPFRIPAVDIATLAAREDRGGAKPRAVKVIGTPVAESRLRAIYFTRAAAPWGEGDLLRHIGVYAFRRSALARFAALPRSPLEKRERLEQLRALEAGMRIDVTLVQAAPIGVDTPGRP